MGEGTLYVVLSTAVAAGGIALGLFLKSRRKTAAEKERVRRLKVNRIGRICDASIVEVTDDSDGSGHLVRHLHYHYTVAGVTYSAAQDISALRGLMRAKKCAEGVPVSVKFDPRNPSNSIVICEQWTGLR